MHVSVQPAHAEQQGTVVVVGVDVDVDDVTHSPSL